MAPGRVPLGQFTSLTNGGLTVQAGTYNLPNLAAVDGSTLSVQGGGSLTLPSVAAIDTGNGYVSLHASDAGSLLSLPALAKLTGYYASVSAYGQGAKVDLPLLASFANGGSISETNGATVVVNAALTTLNGVSITVDGTGTFPLGQFTSVTGGRISVQGGTYTLPNLTDIDGTGLGAENGGSLTLPSVVAANSNGFYAVTFQADAGSVLGLPALATIAGNGVYVIADGAGATVSLPALGTFGGGGSLAATNGGTIALAAGLTALDRVSLAIDATSTLPIDQFTSLTNGRITVRGVSETLLNLTDIDGTSLDVQSGGSLNLPAVTALSLLNNSVTFNASGANSALPAGAGDVHRVSVFLRLFRHLRDGRGLGEPAGPRLDRLRHSILVAQLHRQRRREPARPLRPLDARGPEREPDGHQRGVLRAGGRPDRPGPHQPDRRRHGVLPDRAGRDLHQRHPHREGGDLFPAEPGGRGRFGPDRARGGSLSLPAVTSYNNTSYYPVSFQATGAGSLLDLSSLATVAGAGVNASAAGAARSSTCRRPPRSSPPTGGRCRRRPAVRSS